MRRWMMADEKKQKGIRVTVDDLETGTKEVKEITDDYIIICTGRHYVSGTTIHSNGTHVIVVKKEDQ